MPRLLHHISARYLASYLVWKKYRLRSRACEEFLNRLNGM